MYLRTFILIVILGLSVLPIVNVVSKDLNVKEMGRITHLYNTDILEGALNRVLIYLGISIKPGQVIIGKDSWLFLGNAHNNTISAYRSGSETESARHVAHEIVQAQKAWKEYYEKNGVQDFKIIIGPNKSTIYSEYLPDWAKSNSKSISNNLYNDNDIYVDVRNELINAKDDVPSYYFTDTHWNSRGAGIAFNKLFRELSNDDISTPPSDWAIIVKSIPRHGGDLSKFLKIEEYVYEIEPLPLVNELQLQHIIYEFDSMKEVSNGLSPLYGDNLNLYLIVTPEAINDKKVLWLSDSFGGASASYMTANFSHVLKQHWHKLYAADKLKDIVKQWQPDFVIMTIVERESLNDMFMQHPPVELSGDSNELMSLPSNI